MGFARRTDPFLGRRGWAPDPGMTPRVPADYRDPDPGMTPPVRAFNPDPGMTFQPDTSLRAAARRRGLSAPEGVDFTRPSNPETPSEWGAEIHRNEGRNDARTAVAAAQDDPSLFAARQRRDQRGAGGFRDPEWRAKHPILRRIIAGIGGPVAMGVMNRTDEEAENRRRYEQAREDRNNERRAAIERGVDDVPEGFVRVDGKVRQDPSYHRPPQEIEVPEEVQDRYVSSGGRVFKKAEPPKPEKPAPPPEEQAQWKGRGYAWDPHSGRYVADRSFVPPSRSGEGGMKGISTGSLRSLIMRQEGEARRYRDQMAKINQDLAGLRKDPEYNHGQIQEAEDRLNELDQLLEDVNGELDGMRNEYNSRLKKGPLNREQFDALPQDRKRAYLEQYSEPTE